MRIAIDYTAAVWQGAGIGRYTRELVRQILTRGSQHTYCLFYAAYGLDQAGALMAELAALRAAFPAIRTVPIPLPPRRLAQLWHRLRVPVPVELFTGKIDILHAPDFVPAPARAPVIVTIHDLSYKIHPECALPSVARYLNGAVPRGLRRARAILADSDATRRDLERLMQVAPGRITVVYPGVNAQFRPLPPEACVPVKQTLGLPERFLFFVSTIEPRKNLPRLLEAYALVRPQLGDLALVLAGRKGWMFEPTFAAIERYGLQPHVRWLDYLDDTMLPEVYNLAETFVYPSIYEGFGFPALEAMACGTPVLTVNNSSLPEVVGDAAVLVQADDVQSIAAGLVRITTDQALRTRLAASGPQQARQFTWERAADQVLTLYEQVRA